jgi:hypothetical protein
MSAYGTKRNSRRRLAMSAFGGKADMTRGRSAKEKMVPLPTTGRGMLMSCLLTIRIHLTIRIQAKIDIGRDIGRETRLAQFIES